MRKLILAFLVSSAMVSSSALAQSLGTCHIFPSNNPWNERVDSLPVHWNSAKYIANVGGTLHLHPDFGSDPSYGIPWVAVSSSQPFVPINITGYVDESDPGPMPIPLNAPIESDGDSHVLVVDTGNSKLYELYQGVRGTSGWSAASTAIFALDSNNYRPDGWTSCDAAGLPIWPGLVKKYECDAGEIKHALRFTVQRTQKGWIFPARHEAGFTTDTTVMPMGLRLRLKASFDDSKFTGYAKVIATAMKRYGIILADNGSNWYISGETNTSWPDTDIVQLKQITGNDFEVVYTGPVRTQPDQYPDPVLPLPNGASLAAPAAMQDTARVGDVSADQFTISNTGTTALAIRRYWLKTGSVFQITDSATHSIAAGGHALAAYQFSPLAHGPSFDTLFIASSDSASAVTAVALNGFGTQGIFHLSQDPLTFGTVPIGMSDTMLIVLTNLGDGELDATATPNGTNSDFSLVAIGPIPQPPIVLQPGDSELALFQFSPSAIGGDTSIYHISFSETLGGTRDTALILAGNGAAPSQVFTLSDQPFDLFPNPAANRVYLRAPASSGTSEVQIYNIAGELTWHGRAHAGTTAIDVSKLPQGTYTLRAEDGANSQTRRLLIMR